MRWYVEPLAAQQRSFNLTVLQLVDELAERVEALERRARRPLPPGLMRIAVCAPQVPFERGGTEILAETLVAELRGRGHDVEDVKIPFKWYPGARALREALVWRLVDLEEAQERPGRPRDRDEVPVLRDPPPEQGRLARPPVPAGLRARPRRLRAVRRGPVRPRDGSRRSTGSTARFSARRSGLFAISQQRGRPSAPLDGSQRRGAAPTAAAAGRTARRNGDRRVHPLGRPARPREARRPAAGGGGARRGAFESSSPGRGRTGSGSSG